VPGRGGLGALTVSDEPAPANDQYPEDRRSGSPSKGSRYRANAEKVRVENTMQEKIILKSILCGILAAGSLLAVYFTILTFVSGWNFAQDQFSQFWYFIITLAAGFGIQVGLYIYLKNRIKEIHGEGKVLGVTGTTSTAAMISCCTHYLANLLPILGVAGVVTFVAQYQIELFWVGLVFNLGGIFYIVNRIMKFKRV